MERKELKDLWALVWLAALAVGGHLVYASWSGPERPWYGFATAIRTGDVDIWFTGYQTRKDCSIQMDYLVNVDPNRNLYTAPYGCVYAGDSYYVTWIAATLALGDELHCIVRYTNHGESQDYQPIPKGKTDATVGDGWYCA